MFRLTRKDHLFKGVCRFLISTVVHLPGIPFWIPELKSTQLGLVRTSRNCIHIEVPWRPGYFAMVFSNKSIPLNLWKMRRFLQRESQRSGSSSLCETHEDGVAMMHFTFAILWRCSNSTKSFPDSFWWSSQTLFGDERASKNNPLVWAKPQPDSVRCPKPSADSRLLQQRAFRLLRRPLDEQRYFAQVPGSFAASLGGSSKENGSTGSVR